MELHGSSSTMRCVPGQSRYSPRVTVTSSLSSTSRSRPRRMPSRVAGSIAASFENACSAMQYSMSRHRCILWAPLREPQSTSCLVSAQGHPCFTRYPDSRRVVLLLDGTPRAEVGELSRNLPIPTYTLAQQTEGVSCVQRLRYIMEEPEQPLLPHLPHPSPTR